MGEATGDSTTEAPVGTSAVEQPSTGEVTQGSGQAEGVVQSQPSGIVVGNQTFATQEELVKAYQESMRGSTQASQRHAKEVEAYKAVSDWLSTLKRDPTQWERFTRYVYGKPEAPVTPQAQAQQTPQGVQADPRYDEFRADVEGRIEAQQAQVEYLQFRNTHKDLDDATVQRVVDKVLEWDEQGKERSLEEAYRWILAEENAGKFVSAGQKQAEAAQVASKAAGGVLGTAPPTATQGGAKKEPGYRDMKTVKDQSGYIKALINKLKK